MKRIQLQSTENAHIDVEFSSRHELILLCTTYIIFLFFCKMDAKLRVCGVRFEREIQKKSTLVRLFIQCVKNI